MGRRRKGAVGKGRGAMCNICGLNCGKGGALKKHIEESHEVSYEDYKACFYGKVKNLLADAWDDSVRTSSGQTVITHVLARRFVREPGPRGVRKH